MRYMLALSLALASCGASGFAPSAWPDHDVAPLAGVVDPIDDLLVMDTESDRFGVGYAGSDELVAIGYARRSGDRWTWFTGPHAAANDPFVAEESENPSPGMLYVYAIGLYGTEYLTLVDYQPGTSDGCFLSRNQQWLEAP